MSRRVALAAALAAAALAASLAAALAANALSSPVFSAALPSAVLPFTSFPTLAAASCGGVGACEVLFSTSPIHGGRRTQLPLRGPGHSLGRIANVHT